MLRFSIPELEKLKTFLTLKDVAGKNERILLEKVQKYTGLFQLCPGIKMVAVGNSVAMNNAHKESDIDLFIVTEKKRMWYVRIVLTLILSVLGQRKTAKQHAGKFCLSFFMTEENLSLESITIKDDIYLYYWILTLKPIINNDRTYEKFITENSKWCDFSGVENIFEENKKYIVHSGKTWGNSWKFFDIQDWFYKKIFLPKTLKTYEKLGKPEGVVISDSMLKFHDMDARKYIRDNVLL